MGESRYVDFAWTKPTPQQVLDAGDEGVIGYLSNDRSKNLAANEAQAYLAAGLKVSLVWETTATRATAGYAAGVADANAALGQANALGCPSSVAIFAAVDEATSADSVRPYFQGWCSVLGARAGSYGSATITQAHLTPWTWQTVAWSGGVVDQSADLYQRAQMTHPIPGCDEDVVLNDFPVWMPNGTASTSAPIVTRASKASTASPVPTSGEDMAIGISVHAGTKDSIAVPDGARFCRVVVTNKAGSVRTPVQLADGSFVPLLKGDGADPLAWYAAGNPMTFDLTDRTLYPQQVVAIFVENFDADPVGVSVW